MYVFLSVALSIFVSFCVHFFSLHFLLPFNVWAKKPAQKCKKWLKLDHWFVFVRLPSRWAAHPSK
jgi:hypothetical protein